MSGALGDAEEGLSLARAEEECSELSVLGVPNPGDRPLCDFHTGALFDAVAGFVEVSW